MPRFIIRVELPGKPVADYAALHKDMRAASYRRVIQDPSGKWWHLPHAEYTCFAPKWTVAEICDEVHEIALRHHSKPRIFASESKAWAAFGLRPVTSSDPEPNDGE